VVHLAQLINNGIISLQFILHNFDWEAYTFRLR